jgi:phosphatidylglycerol:prolipoprotein diacylglycerol transferase
MARVVGEIFREPDSFLGFILGTGWITMGMVLSLPLLLFGGWLIDRAYRQPALS